MRDLPSTAYNNPLVSVDYNDRFLISGGAKPTGAGARTVAEFAAAQPSTASTESDFTVLNIFILVHRLVAISPANVLALRSEECAVRSALLICLLGQEESATVSELRDQRSIAEAQVPPAIFERACDSRSI